MSRTLRLLITGGGTGGHTYPALTTLSAMQRRQVPHDVLWVGTSGGLEAKITAEHGIPFKAITTGKLRRRPNLRELGTNIADVFRIPVGVFQAVGHAARYLPDVVLSTGGYVAVPIGVAAKLIRRPLVMHEQTTVVGLANRILSRLATRIALSHESSLDYLPASTRDKAVVTGNPIRPELLQGNRAAAYDLFGLTFEVPLIYVTGGAQGSKQINTLIQEILPRLLPHAQIVHQCGPAWIEQMRSVELPAELADRYHPVPYVGGELPDLYAAADVVIARSGAGTVSELTAIGKPSVLIPLIPTGGDEQRKNAAYLVSAGAARALLEPRPTAELLLAELMPLLADPGRLAAMGEAAQKLGRLDAADALCDLLIQAVESTARPGA
ncbi:UDP-N-acetylglucosamine--N-acetylmuramyl-(pentapeptide) pyrophosphoryl-undecaprenol N-acetylglucosamine transferase [Nonomuraea glycinis]|uniref:UDP-N-acetylglucosamine--N-acetylmuramyl-(pentapeptide) pyrophosphoryl-undecaprenol N-acetylglucosamine transferase n=1 Tax=Nonomuraea glycinis TaxID=2047744 RepID=A0A918E4R4_9ACTN|nr:UDP-N-acetylglucosamine--N-acetylmuramyl-(pentapeptide) pyrophosphoryl-undecaprenol N-acetylglucosamine transferase [Nonomuraea glycinis]MCA2177930.1 UDP-N-acetylglucosamine--N-acetylmuramyl-(pentapeptide) pyrophosphoryl-undecaprenol N-acetylglucosamine transferase [Nonomuraea glycinis]GGP06396.1 UDP-N-acetylglucosamine--N-acetylmuramyl-(pentapeptide) pyrophosphoryl-undecaprenol N-acetylglucosamine transferase 1 [Nonomuraea glycinis]